MAKLKNIDKLIAAVNSLKELAEEYKADYVEAKREWLDNTSEKYQDSDKYSEWDDYLTTVETLCENIDELDTEFPEY